MGVLALSLRLLTVSKIPPPKTCRVFPFIYASVVVSILTFVVSVSAPSLLFPMVASQASEGLLTCLNLDFGDNRLLRLLKSPSCHGQMRRPPKSLRFFSGSGRIVLLRMVSIQIKPRCTISSGRRCLKRRAGLTFKPTVLPEPIRQCWRDRRRLPGGGGGGGSIVGQLGEFCSNTYMR
jgi:hypothetical protein